MKFPYKTSSSSSEISSASVATPQLIEPGTIGNLTAEQERCLQEAWIHLLRLCGHENIGPGVPDKSYEFFLYLNDKSPDSFYDSLMASLLCDNPDALVLRFLRARKWDVVKAVVMLVSALTWREEKRINADIIGGGESVGLKPTRSVDEEAFMMQYRSGKSYVRGTDKKGNPIYIIRVQRHDPHKQSASVMESFALHNIETLRLMAAKKGQDKVSLIFDLTGFGLRNMDFHFIKFLIQILEARYPETLEVVLVHNAPFVFWGIWNVIRHWLDPIIASKIHFTSGNKAMLEFISRDNLQKCYGGDDEWEYKYVEPTLSENERLNEGEKKAKILGERDDVMRKFGQLTAEWVSLKTEGDAAKEKKDQRGKLALELKRNFWQLDPYIRSTTYYDRTGVLSRNGEVDFKAAR